MAFLTFHPRYNGGLEHSFPHINAHSRANVIDGIHAFLTPPGSCIYDMASFERFCNRNTKYISNIHTRCPHLELIPRSKPKSTINNTSHHISSFGFLVRVIFAAQFRMVASSEILNLPFVTMFRISSFGALNLVRTSPSMAYVGYHRRKRPSFWNSFFIRSISMASLLSLMVTTSLL